MKLLASMKGALYCVTWSSQWKNGLIKDGDEKNGLKIVNELFQKRDVDPADEISAGNITLEEGKGDSESSAFMKFVEHLDWMVTMMTCEANQWQLRDKLVNYLSF